MCDYLPNEAYQWWSLALNQELLCRPVITLVFGILPRA